jgi:transmembrane sensor
VPDRLRRAWSVPALAVSVVLVVCTAVAGWEIWRPNHYATGVGEQRSVALEDGSIVTLNTSSEIEVDFTGRQRRVRLVEGEALFEVAHDIRRPFDVSDGNATVRAVGTEFNVDRRRTQTTVTVVEGRVAVIPPTNASDHITGSALAYVPAGSTLLAATEQLVIANGHIGAPARVANVEPVLAWTHRQLVFNRRPIGEVAAEFNRYNRRRIEIADPTLAEEPVSGVFQANDPQSFLTFLTHMPGVRIETAGSSVVVNKR